MDEIQLDHCDGYTQDCGNSRALAVELPQQYCVKPSILCNIVINFVISNMPTLEIM